MECSIKLYKINDFIRKNEAGELDLEKSMGLVQELAAAVFVNPESNILVDLRDTTTKTASMRDILKVTIELGNYRSIFKNKFASIIPDDPERLEIAKQFKASLDLQGFDFKFFTSHDDAIEWFSDIEDLM